MSARVAKWNISPNLLCGRDDHLPIDRASFLDGILAIGLKFKSAVTLLRLVLTLLCLDRNSTPSSEFQIQFYWSADRVSGAHGAEASIAAALCVCESKQAKGEQEWPEWIFI